MKKYVVFLPVVTLVCVWLLLFSMTAALAGSVPTAIIALPENETAILVEKMTQRLYVYRAGSGIQKPDLVFETACSTGEAPGPKQVEGDKKTPEGVYFLTDEYEDRFLSSIYGAKAFPTDYPNFLDRHMGKTGSAIWIHGTDKKLKPMDTNGCIALENDDVSALSNYITRHVTPVIIQEKIAYTTPEKLQEKKQQILSFVDNWFQAHRMGNYHGYGLFYGPIFMPDIQWWDDRHRLRKSPDSPLEDIQIRTPGMGIYQHEDIVVAVMDFVLVSGVRQHVSGRRKLFIRENPGSGLLIVGDVHLFLDKSPDVPGHSLVAGAALLRKSHD
jgi:lipoprotein-anchoring transpeptidase ErfK/SrfK